MAQQMRYDKRMTRKSTYAAFIEECRKDRDRYRGTLRMIQSGELSQSHQGSDGNVVDTKPDYEAHVKRLIAEFDIIIGDIDA